MFSGLALAIGLYASFGNIARLFTSDPEVLTVVKSCALVNPPTLCLFFPNVNFPNVNVMLTLGKSFFSMSFFFPNVNFRFSLSVPVSQLMPWPSSLMVYIMVYQILNMWLKLLYVY